MLLTVSLVPAGCREVWKGEKEAPGPPSPASTKSRALYDNAPSAAPSGSPEHYETHLVNDDSFTRSITPETSSFTIPLYPKATLISGRQARGMTPHEKVMIQSNMEMYSLDSIDEIIRFYRVRKKGLTIREFHTDRGRNVTISDFPELVPDPGPFCSRATTLVLYRGNKEGRTRMTYTGFKIEE